MVTLRAWVRVVCFRERSRTSTSPCPSLAKTGNVLITNAELGPDGAHFGQILEVLQDGTRVFQLDVGDASGNGFTSYGIYRAERIPDIRTFGSTLSPTEAP